MFHYRLFERAIVAAGTDFRSDKLWDAFINWESDLKRVTNIYDRQMRIPLQLYSHHFDRYVYDRHTGPRSAVGSKSGGRSRGRKFDPGQVL